MKYLLACLLSAIFLSNPAFSLDWVETASWFGRGPTTTRTFRAAGERWRLHYTNHGPGPLRIRVFDSEHREVYDIYTRRGFPGIRSMRVGKGDFYLMIEPRDARWEVIVRQRLSRAQEWFLRRHEEETRAGLELVASFSGGQGQTSYPLSLPPGSWRMVYSNSRRETMAVTLTSEDQDYQFQHRLERPKRTETWIHRGGDFVLQVDAGDTRWRVDFFRAEAQL